MPLWIIPQENFRLRLYLDTLGYFSDKSTQLTLLGRIKWKLYCFCYQSVLNGHALHYNIGDVTASVANETVGQLIISSMLLSVEGFFSKKEDEGDNKVMHSIWLPQLCLQERKRERILFFFGLLLRNKKLLRTWQDVDEVRPLAWQRSCLQCLFLRWENKGTDNVPSVSSWIKQRSRKPPAGRNTVPS